MFRSAFSLVVSGLTTGLVLLSGAHGEAAQKCVGLASGRAQSLSMEVWNGPIVDDFPIEDYFPQEPVWLLEYGQVRYSRESWAFRLWRMRTSHRTPDDRFAQHYLTKDMRMAWVRDKALGETLTDSQEESNSQPQSQDENLVYEILASLGQLGILPLTMESPERQMKVALISFKDSASQKPISLILSAPSSMDHGPLLGHIINVFNRRQISLDFATTGWGYLNVVPYNGKLIVGKLDFQPVMSRAIAPYQDLYWELRDANPDRPLRNLSVRTYLEGFLASLHRVGNIHPTETQLRFSLRAGWRSLKQTNAIRSRSVSRSRSIS